MERARSAILPRLAAGIICLLGGVASGQPCEAEWLPGDWLPGANDWVRAATMWDPDGPGPEAARLVVAGHFTVAGNVATRGIATWDPATGSWGALGAGIAGYVRAVTTLPTESGEPDFFDFLCFQNSFAAGRP